MIGRPVFTELGNPRRHGVGKLPCFWGLREAAWGEPHLHGVLEDV